MVLGLQYLENTILLGGMVVIVALAFDHMLNHAGIPAFVNRIPVMLGAFTVSAVSMRLVFAVAASAGVQLLDWGSMQGWIYNNMENTKLVNFFLADEPCALHRVDPVHIRRLYGARGTGRLATG